MQEQTSPEPGKSRTHAARRREPASPWVASLHSLAYVPLPARKRSGKRGAWVLAALLAAGATAAAAVYFRPPAEAAALKKIDAVVVDHYNPFLRASGRPDLQSDKVQFINGTYTVVPNSWAVRPERRPTSP